jgi:hypothetical protein
VPAKPSLAAKLSDQPYDLGPLDRIIGQQAWLQRNPLRKYELLEPVGARPLIIPKDDRQTLLSRQCLYGRETTVRVTRIDQLESDIE